MPLGGGIGSVVCACKSNNGAQDPAFLDSLAEVLENAPAENFVLLLGDVSTHMSNLGGMASHSSRKTLRVTS